MNNNTIVSVREGSIHVRKDINVKQQVGRRLVDSQRCVRCVVPIQEPDAIDQLARFFRKNEISHVLCSSSVDHAEEYGAAEGVDVRAMVHDALTLAVASIHSIKIKWDGIRIEEYQFSSHSERKAFLDGVNEALRCLKYKIE